MRCARVMVSLRALSQPVGSDGVREYYSSTTFGVLVLATPGTRLVLVLEGQGIRSKKALSARVHLAFARSSKLTNKMNFR